MALSDITLRFIQESMIQRIHEGRAFTAYEITLATRDQVNKIYPPQNGRPVMKVINEEVRQVVHESMIDNIRRNTIPYDHELCVVEASTNKQAEVYFHIDHAHYQNPVTGEMVYPLAARMSNGAMGSINPHALAATMGRRRIYSIQQNNATISNISPASIMKAGARALSQASSSGNIRTIWAPGAIKDLDSKFRLRVPRGVLKDAGFHPGDKAIVTFIPNKKIVMITADDADTDETDIKTKTVTVDKYGNARVGLKSMGVKQPLGYKFDTQDSQVVANPAVSTTPTPPVTP